jgi:hypothetical protein
MQLRNATVLDHAQYVYVYARSSLLALAYGCVC